MKTYKKTALIAKGVIAHTKKCCDRKRKRRRNMKREDDEHEL